MARLFLLSFLLLNSVLFSDTGNILVVVPFPAISHQSVFRPLTQELAKRGHEVTVVTTDPAFPKGQAPHNLTEIDLHDLSYGLWLKTVSKLERRKNEHDYSLEFIITPLIAKLFEAQVKSSEFQNILKKDYDLLIIESLVRPALGLTYAFKKPTILMSTIGTLPNINDMVGAPSHPLLYPNPLRQRIYNLTVREKLYELWHYYKTQYKEWYGSQVEIENKMLKELFGKDIPPISELKNNVDMLFLNMHPIFEGNYPVPPAVQYIWGTYRKPPNDLPQDLKSYLESSKRGVIYMSFGTNVHPSLLEPEKIKMFYRVFSSLPYDVLWKWKGDEIPGKPENVRMSEWFPQFDLLRHPNLKLFITQGGLQSTDEAIQAGVPLVGVPFLGDQFYNAEKYVHLGVGTNLDWYSMTEDDIRHAIVTVIENESYSKNMKKLNILMHDDPMDGLQRAVWWTEYVLRHSGASHLRAPAANISWSEYLELELLAVVLSCILLISSIILLVVYKIINILSGFFRPRNPKAKLQ